MLFWLLATDTMKKMCSSSFSKGAVVILIWVGLLRACIPLLTMSAHNTSERIEKITHFVHLGFVLSIYIVLPFLGLLADVKFSRYKFAVISALLSLTGSVVTMVRILLEVGSFEFSESCDVCDNVVNGLSFIDEPLNQIATKSFWLSTILFGLDQLESAGTEQLSSFIWWYYWVMQLDGLINSTTGCSSPYIPHAMFIISGIHTSCVLVIVVSSCALKRWFIIYQRTSNPLLLVARVLNYARKHKYPTNRSALTYWLNDYPPRIDNGKSKYGGPFTEEQVENVKTFFRLLPVLFCTQMVFIPAMPLGRFHQVINGTQQNFDDCLIGSTYFVNYCIALILIPCRMVLIKVSCCKFKFCSTLLKQIGIGILLSMTAKSIFIGFDYYATVTNNNTYCLFTDDANSTDVDYFPIDYHLILIPNVINGLGALLIILTSMEFIVSQTPLEMRGFYLGIMFATRSIYEQVGWYLIKPFQQSPWLWPSCEFYVFILNTLIMVACLLIFIPLSYWYKLRKRDEIFNYHIVAEDFYENDFNRRDQHQCDTFGDWPVVQEHIVTTK